MRRFQPGIGLLIALVALPVGVFVTVPPPAPAASGSQDAGCGERRPVRTLSDRDAGLVNFSPQIRTVAQLAGVRVTHEVYPPDRRLGPQELSTYSVTAYALEARNRTDEGHFHVVLGDLDDPTVTLVVGFPDTQNCATDTAPPLRERMVAARNAFRAAFGTPPSEDDEPLSGIVRVTGVGFFEPQDDQRRTEPSLLTLEPVLEFAVLDENAAPPSPTGGGGRAQPATATPTSQPSGGTPSPAPGGAASPDDPEEPAEPRVAAAQPTAPSAPAAQRPAPGSIPVSPLSRLSCATFPNQAAAQLVFRGNPLDAAQLDENGNGIACEWLPCPCDGRPPSSRVAPLVILPILVPPAPPPPPTATPGPPPPFTAVEPAAPPGTP